MDNDEIKYMNKKIKWHKTWLKVFIFFLIASLGIMLPIGVFGIIFDSVLAMLGFGEISIAIILVLIQKHEINIDMKELNNYVDQLDKQNKIDEIKSEDLKEEDILNNKVTEIKKEDILNNKVTEIKKEDNVIILPMNKDFVKDKIVKKEEDIISFPIEEEKYDDKSIIEDYDPVKELENLKKKLLNNIENDFNFEKVKSLQK